MQIPSSFETLRSLKLGIQKSELHKPQMFYLYSGRMYCGYTLHGKRYYMDNYYKLNLFLLERQKLTYPPEYLMELVMEA